MDNEPAHQGPHQNTHTRTPQEEAFIERMKAISERVKTSGQSLRELYDNGQTEELDEAIDDIATDLRMGDPENTLLLKSLRSIRGGNLSRPQDEAAVVTRIKDLQSTYRDLLVMESGLPNEARLNEVEKAKTFIKEKLQAAGYGGGDPAEALHILGIIDEADGEPTYHFPDYLPESVKEKWCIYLTSVIEHVNSEDALESGSGSKEAVMDADRTRTYAHNSVTKDVHDILGLEGDKGWGFKDTRQLLANIRDYVLPSDDSVHSNEAQLLCQEYHRGFVVSAALSSSRHQ